MDRLCSAVVADKRQGAVVYTLYRCATSNRQT